MRIWNRQVAFFYLQKLLQKFLISIEFWQNHSVFLKFNPYTNQSLFQTIFYFSFWLKIRVIYLANNWIYTTNHKRIAVNYFWFVILAGVVGMVLATAIRLEFAYPGVGIFAGDSLQYLSVASAHGVIMVFFMIMPLLFGAFGNFLLPTQLGVHDVAFPRLNSAAFWFLPSGLIMLAQLVCVDRRFQRMNCFNIREVQALLKQRFFADLINEEDRHSLLDRTMIGTKFRFWGQESLIANNLLAATGGPSAISKNRNQRVESPILENGEGTKRKGGKNSHKRYSKTRLAVISGCIISLHDGARSALSGFFQHNVEIVMGWVFAVRSRFGMTIPTTNLRNSHDSQIWGSTGRGDLCDALVGLGLISRHSFARVELLRDSNRDTEPTLQFLQRCRRFLWFHFVWDLDDLTRVHRLIMLLSLYTIWDNITKFFRNWRWEWANLRHDYLSAMIYVFEDELGSVIEVMSNFGNIPLRLGALMEQTGGVWVTVSQLFSRLFLIQLELARFFRNSSSWELLPLATWSYNFKISHFATDDTIEALTVLQSATTYARSEIFDFASWAFIRNELLPLFVELKVLPTKVVLQNTWFADIGNFVTISNGVIGQSLIRWGSYGWILTPTPITVVSNPSSIVPEFLFSLKQTLITIKRISDVVLIPTVLLSSFSVRTIFETSSTSPNAQLSHASISHTGITINFLNEWGKFHFNPNYVFLESASDSRILRSENPTFKYDYKGGDYFPKNLREGFPSLATTLLNVGGLRPAVWFLSSTFHENVRVNFFPLIGNVDSFFETQSRIISPSNGFNATQWWQDILLLHLSKHTEISTSWNSMISLNHKFTRMFLTSPMQQRVLANWRQLKLTREAWRCKLLATRHQRTLYQRYLNEEGVFWSIERNARDLIPGWAMITPFASRIRFTAIGKVDIGLVGVLLVLNSSIISAANFLVTYRYLSTLNNRKMRDARSFFTEGVMVASWMMIAANPMLVIGIIMLLSDRHWQTSFFDYSGGGDTILFQHMFWFFGHPEVYIIMIPVFGFTNTVLSYYLRKRVSARASLMYSMYTIAFLGFFVWGHHMYMVGLAHTTRMLFSTLTVMISVPAATKLMHWCVTIANSAFSMEVPLLFILTFIFFFISGGISGMCVAHTGMDILFHDTFYVIGHFHVMLAGAAMFGSFGAFYFYFPAIFGVRYSRIYAYLHYSYYLLGQLMTVIPMFWLGYAGMPRRVLDYPASMGGWHSIISAGHLLSVGGMLAFFIMIFDSLRQAKTSFRNTFGINRYNTRLSFYLFEIIRLQRHASRQAFLLKFVKARKIIREGQVYRNWEPAETTLFSYSFLNRKLN